MIYNFSMEKSGNPFERFKGAEALRQEGAEAERRRIVESFLPMINKHAERIGYLEYVAPVKDGAVTGITEAEKVELDTLHHELHTMVVVLKIYVGGGGDEGSYPGESFLYSKTHKSFENFSGKEPQIGDPIELVRPVIYDRMGSYSDKTPHIYQSGAFKVI